MNLLMFTLTYTYVLKQKSLRMVRCWNGLTREVVYAQSLEVLKTRLGGALDRHDHWGPFHPGPFCDFLHKNILGLTKRELIQLELS